MAKGLGVDEQQPRPRREPEGESRGRILVVDDDSDLREDLLDLLRGEGYQAEGAPDGIAGFSLTTKLDPDIIVLDVSLPLVDGFKVGQKFKQDPRTSDIPILFLTTGLDEEAMVSGLALFGCEYLPKPVSRRDFMSKIEGLAHRKALQERLRKTSPKHPAGKPPAGSQPGERDPLTDLPTWQVLRQRLEEEIVRADRHKIPYVFMVLGVDNLAEIGRTFGRDFARTVYRDLASLIRKKTRRYNVVGHFEEALFAIILFQTDREGARIVAERLLSEIAAQELRHQDGRVVTTVSIGMCYLPPEELAILKHQNVDVIHTVLQKARSAFLQAQADGGNRLQFSEPAIEPTTA